MATTPIQLLRSVSAIVTTNATLQGGRHTPVDATIGARTMTLPTPGGAGRFISVEKSDSSANVVNITGSIRGTAGSTISLVWALEAISFISDASGSWWPYAGHKTKASLDTAYGSAGALASRVPIWQANTSYAQNTILMAPDGTIVRKTLAGTTSDGATFVSANWSPIASDSSTLLGAIIAGKAAATHTHAVTDLTATGTRSSSTFLRGDNTWAVPSGSGSVADATSTVKGILQLAGDLAGTALAPTVPGLALKAPLASPAFTGTPTAPTPASGNNSTSVATTAFVASAVAALNITNPTIVDVTRTTTASRTTTTMTDDDTLKFSIAANEVWDFTCIIHYECASAEQIKVDVTAPSGATFIGQMIGLRSDQTGASGQTNTSVFPVGVQVGIFGGNGAGAERSCTVSGRVTNGGTAGTFVVRTAKAVVAGTGPIPTIVYVGSNLYAVKK